MGESLEVEIGNLLRLNSRKLATAESCTGGLIGHRLTTIPGSSDYYLGGAVAYSYDAKVALLDVSWDTLQTYGAVSRETVLEMARGIANRLGADIAISVSGIAGPGGAMPGKPVGTVWVGLWARDGEWARVFHFASSREGNKSLSAQAALQFVFDYLQGKRTMEADI